MESRKWDIVGNQWIYDEVIKHYQLHKNIPSITILRMIGESAVSSDEGKSIPAISALSLLNDYATKNPSDLKYSDDTIKHQLIEQNIKQGILACSKVGDWVGLQKIIGDNLRDKIELPPLKNLLEMQTKPSNDPQNLLNNWFLERQAILALVASTGKGKSVITIQLAVSFACGKAALGFIPQRPYRIMVLQSEDSDNDMAIQRDGAIVGLSNEEIELVKTNLNIVRLRGYTGDKFISAMDTYCKECKPDIIFVNPILKFFGEDPIDMKASNLFLDEVDVLIAKYNCGIVFVNHTKKPAPFNKSVVGDAAYASFGSTAWSNAVRDTIELRSANADESVFKLISGKRADKLGWKEKYVRRSQNTMEPRWIELDDSEVALFKQEVKVTAKVNKSTATDDTVFGFIPLHPKTITVHELMKAANLGDKTIRSCLKRYVDNEEVTVEYGLGKEPNRYSKVVVNDLLKMNEE